MKAFRTMTWGVWAGIVGMVGATALACGRPAPPERGPTEPASLPERQGPGEEAGGGEERAHPEEERAEDSVHQERRAEMVRTQIAARGIKDEAVLAAMAKVPRHLFVPDALVDRAYEDRPLPIGHRQTISQPYIVALMTELVRPAPGKRALDVGTGSGYHAAVLAELVDHVHSIEIVCPLAEQAEALLVERLGYDNLTISCGDGFAGWPEHAPFDVIVVAAAPRAIPPPLIEQLAVGGRLIIPVGEGRQELILVEKQEDGSVRREHVAPVRFVPMTGRALEED